MQQVSPNQRLPLKITVPGSEWLPTWLTAQTWEPSEIARLQRITLYVFLKIKIIVGTYFGSGTHFYHTYLVHCCQPQKTKAEDSKI